MQADRSPPDSSPNKSGAALLPNNSSSTPEFSPLRECDTNPCADVQIFNDGLPDVPMSPSSRETHEPVASHPTDSAARVSSHIRSRDDSVRRAVSSNQPRTNPVLANAAASVSSHTRSRDDSVRHAVQALPNDATLPVEPFAVEIFAGSAGLSAALIRAGIPSVPIDHVQNRFHPKAPPKVLDLTTHSGCVGLWELLKTPGLCYVHLSPPCGTASRARERALPRDRVAKGWPEPKPLRSEQFPTGLPDLAKTNPRDVARVQQANKLYTLSVEVCEFLSGSQIPWTLENPRNSLFWWYPGVENLLKCPTAGDILFQHCMHGGHRDKWTRLRSSPMPAFAPLSRTCDNSHPHKPWGSSAPGKFATAEEAEFPDVLCDRIAACVRDFVMTAPVGRTKRPTQTPPVHARDLSSTSASVSASHVSVTVPDLPTALSAPARPAAAPTRPDLTATQAHRIAAAVQPRGNASPAVISEFRATSLLPVHASDLDRATALVGTRPAGWNQTKFPEGSKVLSLRSEGGDGRDCVSFLEVGLPWTPAEFVQQSLRLEHPFSALSIQDDALRSVLFTLTSPLQATCDRRDQALDHWIRRAAILDEAEARLRESVHADVKPSLQTKRVLLFGEMLASVGFPHHDKLVHRMCAGFPLAGEIERTYVFPECRRPAESQLSDLWRSSREAQRIVLQTLGPSGDAALDTAVTDATADEVERGWLRGPYTVQHLSRQHGLWTPARRFGINQGGKVRVIDDYSELGQNACVGSSEKVDVGGIDIVASLARGMLAAIDHELGCVRVTLSDGSVLEGPLHTDWAAAGSTALVGKVWDLARAYRQLARSPAHASISIIATWNARTGTAEFYEQVVLPFGSTASVYDFNWVARALQALLLRGFGVSCTHYFDDYPTLEFAPLAQHTQQLVDKVFSLLGWDIKEQVPFASRFDALGVVCDLSDSTRGVLRFANKPGRVEEISRTVDGLVEKGFVRRGEARSLRGRFIYARGQTFGRCGAVALRVLGDIANGTKGDPALTTQARGALSWLVLMLRTSRPRELRIRVEPPIVLFVDGACEERDGATFVSVGAVLFDAARPEFGPYYFGVQVLDPLVSAWSVDDKTQLIGQAELLPVLLAKTTWPSEFKNRFNITFIDNNSARFGLIRGYSPVRESAAIINETWLMDSELATGSWYARVPTASNIADKPSRLEFSELEKLPRAKCFKVSLPDSWGQGSPWDVLTFRLSRNFS